MLSTVIMDCRGLVDPQNKPFGRVLPLEIQIKIMFWVHCFYTMDKRKKVVREFKTLPKCAMTGWPKHLGEDLTWNQVIVRMHAPRTNGCHHCHRILDHRMSIGMMAEMARVPPNLDRLMNEGIAFVIRHFNYRIAETPLGERPVMIGRRKPSYDSIDKVMKRLDLIHKVMEAMDFVIVDVK